MVPKKMLPYTLLELQQNSENIAQRWLQFTLSFFASKQEVNKILQSLFEKKEMGNCANSPKLKSRASRDSYDIEPRDISVFANKSLPMLHFHSLLRKVKLVNPPNSKHSLRFVVGTYEQLILPEKQPDLFGKIRWNVQQKFQYTLTQYQLRKTYLIIQLLHEEIVTNTLKINLFLISTGPYHLDFLFPDQKKDQQCRISFDLKISQLIDMKIQTQILQLYNTKDFIGEEYAFSMRAIIGDISKSSEKSSKYKVDKKPEVDKPQAVWQSSPYTKLPTLTLNAPYYQLKSSTLKYTLWRIDKMDTHQPQKIVGQSYISFVKLLSFESIITKKDSQQYQLKCINLTEKLLNGSQLNGKIVLKLKFQLSKHIKQMMTFVRTQNGILKASPVLVNHQNEDKKFGSKQIEQLRSIHSTLINEQAELQKKKRNSNNDRKGDIEENIQLIQAYLDRLLAIMKKSQKQSIKSFTYPNQDELMKAQQLFIDIGNKLLNFLNNQSEKIEILKCKILCALIIRGELSLAHIGFDGKEQQNLSSHQLEKKKIVAAKCQRLSYSLLEETFRILHTMGISEQKKLAQRLLAILYIRIPEFRQRFLELINKVDDPRIQEWKGTQFQLNTHKNEHKNNQIQEDIYQSYFNWPKNFYSYIKDRPDYLHNLEKLKTILGNRQWQFRISNRKGAFFAFISQLIQFITNISIRVVQPSWKSFPGYIQIVRGFLAQMKILQIRSYPSSIKDACGSLLSNQILLNIFINIMFNKTSIHNYFDVIKILGLTSSFFHSLKKMDKKISSTFNYRFFFKGIKMAIQSFYSYSTAKAIYLIYQHFQFFPLQFQIQICNYLLGRIFFKLFLNWSFNVRTVFHHIMVIRISGFLTRWKSEADKSASSEKISFISERYSKLLTILQNVKQIKDKQITPSTENQLYKKLKNNLRKKKKNQKIGSSDSRVNEFNQKITLDKLPSNVLQKQFQRQLNQAMRQENNRIMKNLSESKRSQYHSHEINKNIQNALVNSPSKTTKQYVVRRKMTFENEQISSHNNLRSPEKQTSFEYLNEKYEVQMPMILQEDTMYIKTALIEFHVISKQYLKNIKEMKEDPMLDIEIALDESEMKPDNYGDVDQW